MESLKEVNMSIIGDFDLLLNKVENNVDETVSCINAILKEAKESAGLMVDNECSGVCRHIGGTSCCIFTDWVGSK